MDVKAFVAASRSEVPRQRNRHPADAAANIQHSFVWLESAERDEVIKKLITNHYEIATADEELLLQIVLV